MKHLEKFVATFSPKRTDDLVPGAAAWIGKAITVQFAGTVDHKCEYQGQPRFDVLTPLTPMAWVPGCDLTDLSVIV